MLLSLESIKGNLLTYLLTYLLTDVTTLANNTTVHAQRSLSDDVIRSVDQSEAVRGGEDDVTLSRGRR